jgi:large subunit ribosomal protein L13e
MGFSKNNVLHRNHFRKDWQRRIKTWFDQPGQKKSRRNTRQQKAAKLGARCVHIVSRCPSVSQASRSTFGLTLELPFLQTHLPSPTCCAMPFDPIQHEDPRGPWLHP